MPGLKVTDDFSAPEGEYKVTFGEFATKDESGQPVAKAGDQGLRVYAHFVISDGEYEGEVVPCSMDLAEQIASWCLVFSGSLPMTSDIAGVERQMKTGKVVTVRVNDRGWVRGIAVPVANYLAKFVRFTKRHDEEKPSPVQKDFRGETRDMVYWQFEIVAGDYVGVTVPASCRYAVRSRGDELELNSKTSLYNWLLSCGVDFGTLPVFEDMDNILPEMEEIMQRANVVVSVHVGETGWIEGGQQAVSPAPAGIQVVALDKKPLSGTAEEKPQAQSDALTELVDVVNADAKAKGFDEAVVNGQLTEAGKKYAAEYIGPLCDKYEIPRSFTKMTDDQKRSLAEALRGTMVEASAATETDDDFPF